MNIELVLLLAACTVGIWTDVRERKIPNWLTGGLAAGALVAHVPQGFAVVGAAVAAAVALFIVGTLAHSCGILGGGDVKLLAAGALAAGYPDCLVFVLYTFMGGGALAVVFAIAQGRLRSTLVNVRALAQTRTLLAESAPSARMPYAIAIAFGAAAVALAETILPAVRFPT
jgi:prepilin peptidase CpaA